MENVFINYQFFMLVVNASPIDVKLLPSSEIMN